MPLHVVPVGDDLQEHSKEWFWPDPLSRLGTVSSAGDGWHYLTMCTDKEIGKQLGISEERRNAIRDIRAAIIDLDRNRRANGLPTSRRHEIWTKGAATAQKMLLPKQHLCLRQLLMQRHSYRAFPQQIVIEHLKLTKKQQTSIDVAIRAHIERLKRKKVETAEIRELFEKTASETNRDTLQRQLLLREGGAYGRASHRRVWEDIHQILSVDQRTEFNELRGAMLKSIRASLKAFPNLDEWEPLARAVAATFRRVIPYKRIRSLMSRPIRRATPPQSCT
ncbi:MAG: hypothetical protein VB878_19775 [Pirellulaceae bacterium]